MLLDKVVDLIAEQMNSDPSKINEDTNILDDLGADSLDVVDLIMTLEDEFDIKIADEDVDTICTVGELVRYLESHTAEPV